MSRRVPFDEQLVSLTFGQQRYVRKPLRWILRHAFEQHAHMAGELSYRCRVETVLVIRREEGESLVAWSNAERQRITRPLQASDVADLEPAGKHAQHFVNRKILKDEER